MVFQTEGAPVFQGHRLVGVASKGAIQGRYVCEKLFFSGPFIHKWIDNNIEADIKKKLYERS